ncbi:MAG TPA: XdhC/CoxI family protein [Gemmatimonadaceae bacterium]|nr:XdhC/CoxI family protein [Gemmatimonadaceae bacterium]
MDDTFEQLDQLRRSAERVAMATLVATRGTTPKREGAKMWVGEGGRILGSVTIGGCVDARVIELAERVLDDGTPQLLSMSLGDDDAWELGLTCGGTVQVLVERLDFRRKTDPVVAAYAAVRAEVENGRHVAVVSPLGGAQARLVVRADGVTDGTLGDPALDARAREHALSLIAQGVSRTVDLGGEAKPYEAFVEVHGPRRTLVIFGAGHVAMPLVAQASTLGLRTILVDARERFATRDRFPQADEIRVGIPSEIAAELRYGPSTFVVLVAHDYKFDLPILRTVLATDASYIGLLGSRRRGRAILEHLAGDGIGPEALERVHVPIGLDIGARTAAEIALSILAEALAVRAGRQGAPLRERTAT